MNQNKEKGIRTMKKKNLITYIASFIFLFSGLIAKEAYSANKSRSASKVSAANGPSRSVLNINQHAYWISDDGAYTTAGSPNGQQSDYPIFTGGLIYADGMLWGGIVKDSMSVVDGDTTYVIKSEPGVRVGGSTYGHGLMAGRVLYDANGAVIGADDPSINHVWRVRKDWQTADLTVDAANYAGYASTGLVTDADIDIVKEQYEYDWTNWPAAWGAPYEDVNGDGTYDPTIDIPGYVGADQTLWTVANDVPTKFVDVDGDGTVMGEGDKDANGDYTTVINNSAPTLYGSDAIGIELQITLWGYALGAGDPLGNVIFKKAKMIYTGTTTTPAGAMMDDLYFTQWSDPDLGTYTDDYVGTDVDLSFGFVYNGNRLDGVFNGIYNLPVPSGGYDFFQGPRDNKDLDSDGDVDEFLGMTSFTYFGAGSAISDPDLSEYNGSLQFYNLMEGFLPRPEFPTQIPWTDLATGEDTKFVLSGDPVTGTGWVDGVQLPPGDRRMVMASGPFMMNRGDTTDIVLGIVGGVGLDQLSSVSVAKFHDKTAQYAYDVEFDLPSAPKSPVVSGLEMDGRVSLDWSHNSTAVTETEETVSKGFEFEGYVVYQLPNSTSPLSEAVKVATYDRINDVTAIADEAVDLVTGQEVTVAKQVGTDSGIQRYFHADYDEIRGRPMSNGITYFFAVTAYSYLPNSTNIPFKTLESAATIVAVTPHSMDAGYVYDETGSSSATHSGTADATVDIHITNVDSVVGGDYQVTFDSQLYEKGLDGIWTPVTSGRVVNKVSDCSGSTVSAAVLPNFAADGSGTGTLDLKLVFTMDCGSNWVDGVGFVLPIADMGTINSWSISGGGNLCSYGTASGQNCNNLDGTLDDATSTLLFGTINTGGGFGAFESSNEFTINYTPPAGWAASDFTALSIGFTVYDDAYDYTEVNATGTATTPNSVTLETKTEYHWNLSTTSGRVIRENQTFINGTDLYGGNSVEKASDEFQSYGNSAAQIPSEGFQVFVNGNYEAPIDATARDLSLNQQAAALYGDASFDIDSYYASGWAPTAMATDINGYGISDVNILQRDIQVRFTGEFSDTPHTIYTDANGDSVEYYSGNVADNGGSMAWFIGARYYSMFDHPEMPAIAPTDTVYDDGVAVAEPFRIWMPFEVWDMEAVDESGNKIEGGQKIDIAVYDRIQDAVSGGNPDDPGFMYSFNPYNRMYTFFIHTPYLEDGGYYDAAGDLDASQYYTWNVVWWETQFNQGDAVTFKYDNPIQLGQDTFTFSTTKKTESTDWDLESVSVYPNPYYGFHEIEGSRGDKYVQFNNLPASATLDIYSLGGVFVKSLKHGVGESVSSGQHVKWDLNNQYGYPVASGVYIVRISSDGKEKILKLALVQETQVLKYY